MSKKTKKAPASTSKPSTGEKVEVRHEFSAEEWRTKTNEMVALMQQIAVKEEQVKAAQAVAKSEVKQLRAQLSDMANQVRHGYETREIDALVVFDRKKGSKDYYVNAPGTDAHNDYIKTAPMTEDDYMLLPPADPIKVGGAKPEAAQAPEKKEDSQPPAPAAAESGQQS